MLLLVAAASAGGAARDVCRSMDRMGASNVRELLVEARDRYPGPERYPEANQQAFEAKAQEAFAALGCVDEVLDKRTTAFVALVRALYDGTCDQALADTILVQGLARSEFPATCVPTDQAPPGAETPSPSDEPSLPAAPLRRVPPPVWGRFVVNGGEPQFSPGAGYVLQRLDGDVVRHTEFVPANHQPAWYPRMQPLLGGVIAGTAVIAGAALAGAYALDQQVNGSSWNHTYHSPEDVRAIQATNHALVITAVVAGAVSVNAAVGLGLTFR